jgi:hypothetical protein
MVKMIVYGNLPAGLGGEKPQAVLRISVTVITVLGKPTHADAFDIILFPPVGKFIDLYILTIFPVYNLHNNLRDSIRAEAST